MVGFADDGDEGEGVEGAEDGSSSRGGDVEGCEAIFLRFLNKF